MSDNIFDKMHLSFVKKRVVTLCLGESARGYRTLYADAADAILEKLYGTRRIATKILDSRSYQDVSNVLNKIDYEAFFQMLRGDSSFKMLAMLVLFKYKLDRGDIDSKNKKVINKAIAKLVDEFEIRSDPNDIQFEELFDFVKGRGGNSRGYDYVDLFDDERPSKKRRGKHGYDNLFDLDDDDDMDDFGSGIRNVTEYVFDDDLTNPGRDVFAEFCEAETRKAERRRSRRPEKSSYRDRDNDFDDMDNDENAAILESVRKLSETVNNLVEMNNSSQNYVPRNYNPAPPPPRQNDNRDVLQIVEKLAGHIDDQISQLNTNIEDLAKATSNTFDDVYDKLCPPESASEVTEVESQNEGNFVQSSQDFLNSEIAKSVSRNSDK